MTEKIRKDIIENPQDYPNCDVRVRCDKFYTDKEHQRKIEDGLNRELSAQKKLRKIKTK